ncbi:phospholipase A2 inhibitor and Ly6/PLAUR domain-containing protein-like [Hyla sarda]|uniref:phospholipase A2 inhibitor and Ly6/PLAUR domain-containing protein-like n=1 Tax=Hyla sarda TaxID=327740 RepID=UPI0024C2FEFF|nr:phospholipase A2 inhibitor and Ly6/PLAUR domain-containing protein-like [Hyla sarda]
MIPEDLLIWTLYFINSCSKGLALECLQCMEANSYTCDGVSVQCPNSTECMVISQLYRIDDTEYHSIKKGCNPGYPCNKVQYVSNFENNDKIVNVQCCTGNNCNNGDYHVDPLEKEHRGRICPACFERSMKECYSNHTIQCLKEEDKCINYIGRIIDPGNNMEDHSFKGCLSPLACVFGFETLIAVQEIHTVLLECSD